MALASGGPGFRAAGELVVGVVWKLCVGVGVKHRLEEDPRWPRCGGRSNTLGKRPLVQNKSHIAQLPEMPRTVYLGPSPFSLLSLSNTKNLCFRKAGAGATQHLPQNPTLRF